MSIFSLFFFIVLICFATHTTTHSLPSLLESPSTCMSRLVSKVLKGVNTSDGGGVKLKRTIGGVIDNVDPFLLLDEFKSDNPGDYIAGFPDHPHRGFETVTYMLAGKMEHRDHKGNQGILEAGSVQWMTAGRGIIHSETPLQENGLMWGFQLWVNLPAKDKMIPPRYQDIPPDRIPKLTREGGIEIRVIAGEADGVQGPVQGIATAPTYLDISLPKGQKYKHTVPEGHAAFVYVFVGEGEFGPEGKLIPSGHLGVLADGDTVEVSAPNSACRFLLIAGKPLKEPIARHGPFVMNTREEIMQAFLDYQSGKLQI